MIYTVGASAAADPVGGTGRGACVVHVLRRCDARGTSAWWIRVWLLSFRSRAWCVPYGGRDLWQRERDAGHASIAPPRWIWRRLGWATPGKAGVREAEHGRIDKGRECATSTRPLGISPPRRQENGASRSALSGTGGHSQQDARGGEDRLGLIRRLRQPRQHHCPYHGRQRR